MAQEVVEDIVQYGMARTQTVPAVTSTRKQANEIAFVKTYLIWTGFLTNSFPSRVRVRVLFGLRDLYN